MGANNPGSESSFLLTVSGMASTAVQMSVVQFEANEWISFPYSVEISSCTTAEIKSIEKIVGKEALLTILNRDKKPGVGDRYFHGVIRKFEHIGHNGGFYLYEAEVVPTLQQLSLRKNFRIFQDMQVQDIIQKILEEWGINTHLHRFALENKQRLRGNCVQYGETDFDFVTRLMEEEGIFYFFEHYKDKHVLVMSDSPAVHLSIKGRPSISFNSNDGLVPERESVSNFSCSVRQLPGAYTHRNFNFKNPTLDLTAQKNGANPVQLEIYDYPSLHINPDRGEMLAETRLEQLTALQKQGHGKSSSCRLIPGYKFTLTGHKTKSLNGNYLIIDVNHSGSQPQSLEEMAGGSFSYDNSFTVIPAETTYRPAVPREKPVVKGVQTATVVGPEGEEIHTDDYGRVKVQFHWDREGRRDDKSSCWLRVSQAWGGAARGGQYIPRIGDEVLVDFIDGDPDRPIVVGSVYNSDNMPINNLKQSITQSGFKTKTHKGDGFHELRFDDAKGSEEIFLHSQKDWNIMIQDRKGQTVGGDSGTVIAKNCDKSVGGDKYTFVKGKDTKHAKEITIAATDNIILVCGASSIIITPDGIKINNPTRVDINDGSSVPMPPEQPVSGCTGGGGGGGGGGKPKPSPVPAKREASPPAQPPPAEKAPEPTPVKPEELQAGSIEEASVHNTEAGVIPALVTPAVATVPTTFATAATPVIEDANALEAAEIIGSHKDAKAMIDNTVKCLEDAKNNPSALLNKYFSVNGNTAEGKAKIDTLIGNYQKMGAKMESIGYEVEHEVIKPGEPGKVAYVYALPVIKGVGDVHTVYPMFSTLSKDERAATIIHEMSHYELGTEDHAYEWDAELWNNLTPDQQMDNADSYYKFSLDCSAGIK